MRSSAECLSDADEVLKLVIRHPMQTWVDGLEQTLSPRKDIEVVTAHTSSSWIRHAVVHQQADVLLVHVALPGMELQSELVDLFEQTPELGVVALSDSRDNALLCAAIRAGVRGWVEPTASLSHLVRVLHGVARGETWFPPALMTSILEALLKQGVSRDIGDTPLSTLSVRELEVLSCLVQGLSRQQTADQLSVSPHTVRTHINNLLHKLGVHTTLAAVSIARQCGFGASVRSRDGCRNAEHDGRVARLT